MAADEAAFVAAREPERSLVTEMAAFEWALGLALDVVDSAPLSVEALQTLPPEEWPELPLAAHPSLKRFSFHFDTPTIWKAIDNACIREYAIVAHQSREVMITLNKTLDKLI